MSIRRSSTPSHCARAGQECCIMTDYEKMSATEEFRLRLQRDVVLQPRDIYSDRQNFDALL